MFTLTDCIPHEIIVSILQSCSYVEIIAFSRTCKTYHDLVTRSSRLQLHVELESSGFQLSDMGFKRGTEGEARVLVEEFKRFRDGWLYLKIGKPLRLEPVDPDMRLYELRQGYYAAALSSTYTLPGIVKLISLHDKSSSRILSLGIQFSEFQIDPSQGLMVLVAVTDPISMVADIHLRSVFKAHPHRDAAYPDWTIHLPFHMDRRSSGIFVEVMDELLAIKFVSYEKDLSDILVWNWKSGHLLNRIEVQGLSCTFGFLTADSLVVFHSTERPSLHLLIYSDIRTSLKPSEHQPKCQVGDWPSMTPAYDFGFPDFPDSSFAYLLMRSEPAPTLYSTGPAMFLPKPETRVIQLSMTVIQNTGRERGLNQYQIFLSKERLLQVVERIPESSSTVDVPWEEWGELTTRWFNTSSTISPWICRAFGTRFIQSYPCGGDDDSEPVRPREYLSVLEFHQPTIRRLARHGCDERLSLWGSKEARRHYDLDCTDEETEYVLNTLWNGAKSGDEVFVDTIDEDVPSRTPFNGGVVVTRLPYRIVTRRKPVVKHSGWMMDNDVIIGMPTCRTYHELVAQSSLLQLHIELQANGFQLSEVGLGKGGEVATRALLEEFRRFRDGWLYLKIGEPLQIEPANSDMRLYELRQGYYAAAISKAWNIPGHVKLLSLHDKSSAQTIHPGVQFREFQLDPSQDLMVLVSIAGPISIASTVHLFSMLEARPHPIALHPDWSVNLPFFMDYRTSGIFVEIMDDLLAIKYISYEGGASNVLIWNWKTGCLLNRIEIEGLSCTFGFLTADSLILFQSTEVSSLHLLVYSNIRTSLHPTSEHIPDCNSSDWPAISPSFDFGFPPLPVSSFAYLLMRSEPVPTLHSSGPAKFLPTPEARVIQLSLTVIQDIGRERELSHYQIFLSKERLLRLIENPPEYTSPLGYSPVPSWFSHMSTSLFPPSDTIHVPWEAWGERATRWFDSASAIRPWICRAFGTRFIRTYPCETHESDLARPYEYLSILEFHPATVRRFSSLGCDKHLSMWQSKEARRHYDLSCTDEETEYVLNALHRGGEEDEVFVDTIDEDVPSCVSFNGGTVTSRLPYRVVTKRKPVLKHSGWMMDNNVIVGMPPWRRDDLENVQSEYMNIFTPLA